MENHQNYIDLNVADGTNMAAYTAFPENRQKVSKGLLLFQEAFGVNHHIRNTADKFAREGFLVIAPELFHRSAPKGFEASYADFGSVTPHLSALTNEGIEADIKASYDWLKHQGIHKIYSIGYCMGGRASFLANAVCPLNAAVSYYGGGIDKLADKAVNLHGKHLFFWGGKDQHIKQENIDTAINAVKAASKEYINVVISYADHGFNCDERPAFNEAASKEAWALTMTFFDNN